MKISHLAGALCALSILVPTPSFAAIVNLTSFIDGAQANAGAGTGSTGTGSATMTLDDTTLLFNWNITWSGLVSEIAAHFHGPALPNQNAGVQVGIGVASNPAISSATLTAAQTADLLAGLWYINIHTAANPGGEIRGQVSAIPVPAAVWLFGSGLLGLIGMARRKRA
jgi:hypothetical protein